MVFGSVPQLSARFCRLLRKKTQHASHCSPSVFDCHCYVFPRRMRCRAQGLAPGIRLPIMRTECCSGLMAHCLRLARGLPLLIVACFQAVRLAVGRQGVNRPGLRGANWAVSSGLFSASCNRERCYFFPCCMDCAAGALHVLASPCGVPSILRIASSLAISSLAKSFRARATSTAEPHVSPLDSGTVPCEVRSAGMGAKTVVSTVTTSLRTACRGVQAERPPSARKRPKISALFISNPLILLTIFTTNGSISAA